MRTPPIVRDLERRLNQMDGAQRALMNSLVQECYEFVDPMNAQIIGRSPQGTTFGENLYDPTAQQSLETFVSGMNAYISPPGEAWIDVSSDDPRLDNDSEVSGFYDFVTNQFQVYLARSNFDLEIQQVYSSLGISGRPAVFCFPKGSNGIFFKNYPYADTFIQEGHDGIVDSLFRRFRWTPRQAQQRWGPDKLSKRLNELAKHPERAHEEVGFIHAVYPRNDRDITRIDRLNKPIASVYYESDTKHLIDEGGFDETPFAAPRFYKADHEVEGRSPTMKALASTRMLNAMMLTIIKRANRDSDPPLLLPDEDLMTQDTGAGSRIYYAPTRLGAKPEYLVAQNRYDLTEWAYKVHREAIQHYFFNDFFALMQTLNQQTTRTAFEINQRLNEKVDLLSRVRSRTKVELLDILMSRAINVLYRQGVFGEVPNSVRESPGFKFEYRGRLAILAKSLKARNVMNYIQTIIPLSEAFPGIKDYVDEDKFNLQLADLWNIGDIRRSDREVLEIRVQRNAVQSAQVEAAIAKDATESLKNLSGPVDPSSPVDSLVNELVA